VVRPRLAAHGAAAAGGHDPALAGSRRRAGRGHDERRHRGRSSGPT
jgi:hypothetical protein